MNRGAPAGVRALTATSPEGMTNSVRRVEVARQVREIPGNGRRRPPSSEGRVVQGGGLAVVAEQVQAVGDPLTDEAPQAAHVALPQAVDSRQRVPVAGQRLRVGVETLGPVAGRDGVPDGAAWVTAVAVVPCEVDEVGLEVVGEAAFDDRGSAAVEFTSPREQQAVVGDILEQVLREDVAS